MAKKKALKEKTHTMSKIGSEKPAPIPKPTNKDEFVLRRSHSLNGNSIAPGLYKVGDYINNIEITESVRQSLLSRDATA